MSNKGSKPGKKELNAGFTQLDNRLLAKNDITLQQKVLLSYVVNMMNNTNRFNASNQYITTVTGLNKKTIGAAFKVFTERGWLYHEVISGGGRWIHFNGEHRANLKKYIGTHEEYYDQLKLLKKYNQDGIPPSIEVGQIPEPQGIKIDNVPPTVMASEKVTEVKQLTPTFGSDDKISDDLVTAGELFPLNQGKVEPKKAFGEPDTIEYFYCGTWFTIIKTIDEEIKYLKLHIEGITTDLIKRACAGDDVDTGGFQFRYK